MNLLAVFAFVLLLDYQFGFGLMCFAYIDVSLLVNNDVFVEPHWVVLQQKLVQYRIFEQVVVRIALPVWRRIWVHVLANLPSYIAPELNVRGQSAIESLPVFVETDYRESVVASTAFGERVIHISVVKNTRRPDFVVVDSQLPRSYRAVVPLFVKLSLLPVNNSHRCYLDLEVLQGIASLYWLVLRDFLKYGNVRFEVVLAVVLGISIHNEVNRLVVYQRVWFRCKEVVLLGWFNHEGLVQNGIKVLLLRRVPGVTDEIIGLFTVVILYIRIILQFINPI